MGRERADHRRRRVTNFARREHEEARFAETKRAFSENHVLHRHANVVVRSSHVNVTVIY